MGGGALHTFWVPGSAIGNGIDFQNFSTKTGIDFQDSRIKCKVSFFRKVDIEVKVGPGWEKLLLV